MNIGFVGLGKLGYPVACGFALAGHNVMGYDIVAGNMSHDPKPFKETGPDGIDDLNDWRHANPDVMARFTFGSMDDIAWWADIVFVAVQTPHDPRYEGVTPLPADRVDFDYAYLKAAVQMLGAAVKRATRRHVYKLPMAIISTVLPGTMDAHIRPLMDDGLTLLYNPYFIAMGTTLRDFMNPEFVLLGRDDDDDWPVQLFHAIYGKVSAAPVIEMSVPSAELTKVAYNTFISMKLAFVNTLMEICHKTPGANVDEVTGALTRANRRLISGAYMTAGMGDGGGCLPAGQLVLTEYGPRPIETIEPGTRVLTRDGSLRPVMKRWERDYEGIVVDVKAEGQPTATLTEDHPMIVADDGRPIGSNGRRYTNVATAELLSPETERPLSELSVGAFIPAPTPIVNAQVDLPNHVTPEYCEYAGWYLSEGSLDIRTNRSGRVSLHMNIDKQCVADHLAELLVTKIAPPKTIGRGAHAKPTITVKNQCVTLRYGSLVLAERILADFGKLAKTKVMPSWAVYGPLWAAEALMKGLWQGDGHVDDINGFSLSTSSVDIAYGTQLVLQRLGISSTLQVVPPRKLNFDDKDRGLSAGAFDLRVRNARFFNRMAELTGMPRPAPREQKLYTRFPERDGTVYRKITKLDRKPFVGKVYNLWVDENHTYATAIGVVHNCHPRDNIAMSALARRFSLSHDIFEDVMIARQYQTGWLAEMAITAARKANLPIVVLGKAFKPETELTVGSPAVLLYNLIPEYMEEWDDIDHSLIDPYIDGFNAYEKAITRPAVFVIGCKHMIFRDYCFADGSIVIDPWRYLDQGSVGGRGHVRLVSVGIGDGW